MLVIEDEALVAMNVIDILQRAEAKTIGPAGTTAEALQVIVDTDVDVALVDANLRGERVDAIASALAAQNIPFVFVTGYDRGSLPTAFQSAPLLSKPFTDSALLDIVSQAVAKER